MQRSHVLMRWSRAEPQLLSEQINGPTREKLFEAELGRLDH